MVQVLIATRRRPEYLREALESVRAQSAVDRIGTVVVSENGSSRDSQKVCLEFPDLPILYLFQEPELDAMAHARVLAQVDRHPTTAILHDDDWWTPCHLEVALKALDGRKECQAFFANHLELFDAFPSRVHRSTWRVWAAAGKDFRPPILRMNFIQVLVANMLATSFHYSTLVAQTGAYRSAMMTVFNSGNAFDNDRMTPVLLADPGGLAYSTIPTAIIRRHGEQDSKRECHAVPGHYNTMAETSRWIQRRWPTQCHEAARSFNEAVQGIGEEQLRLVSGEAGEPFRSCLAEELGFNVWRPQLPLLERIKRRLPVAVRSSLRHWRHLLRGRRS
jgi:glycosyltransferase involved in cell wall biosynthesis